MTQGPWSRLFWLLAGHAAVVVGLIGIALPLLPTTPFLLLAAACYARGSKRFETWLLEHPKLGPPIHDWRRHGVIRRRAKVLATVAMALSLSFPVFIVATPAWAKVAATGTGIAVLAFLWSRPEGPTSQA